MSFLFHEAASRLKKNSLISLTELIDWENLRNRIGNLGRSGYGPAAYDPLKMLKALILQSWHSLSDESLEEALRVRLDFMVITGFIDVPDATTICRFRGLLMKGGLLETLLLEINKQLESKGLKIKESKGAILDATVITSAARPRKELEATAGPSQEEEVIYKAQGPGTLSKDPDATWVKKGKRSFFGYKCFMITDQEDGYITGVHVTSAHVSEVKELGRILPKLQRKGRLYADKGYASAENKDLVKVHGMKNGIMEKAKKNKPLSSSQKRFNKRISKVRYKVEQGFGTLKRKFKFERASYMSLVKVEGQMALKALAFNLLKALNKVKNGYCTPSLCL